jgi:transketolase
MRNKFADVVYEIGSKDERVCALVADISPAGSMLKFREQFPKRFINTGVAEQSMIGIAAGLALRGMKPVCYTIATFSLYRPFEMIRVDLCYQNLPVTIIGMGAGVIYSTLGGTHHSMEDISIATSLPNMTVLAPCDPLEMRLATEWCLTQSKGPVYMRLGKAGEPDLTSEAVDSFEIGKIRKLKKGKDLAIISYGITLKMCFEIENSLKDLGIEASIYSCHTIKPFDRGGLENILDSYKKVVTIEEHVPQGGLATNVKDVAWSIKSKCEILTFTLKDEFIHFYGDHSQLLDAHGISPKKIINKIVE